MRLHTLQSIIDSRAEKTPSRLFFLSPESGLSITYGQLRDTLRACGGIFDSVPMGGTAGVMAGNGWAAVQCLLAVPYHGRRVLLINTMAGKAGVTHAITHSGCPLIFADAAHIEILRELVAANNINIVPIDCDTGIAADTPTTPPSVKINDDALLIYTSGTTGKPKGVLHTHGSLLAGGANTALAHQLTENDRAFCVLPLCHINAQCVTVMGALASGGGVVVPHKFSVAKFGDSWHRRNALGLALCRPSSRIFYTATNRRCRCRTCALGVRLLRRWRRKHTASLKNTLA